MVSRFTAILRHLERTWTYHVIKSVGRRYVSLLYQVVPTRQYGVDPICVDAISLSLSRRTAVPLSWRDECRLATVCKPLKKSRAVQPLSRVFVVRAIGQIKGYERETTAKE
jgi:hypothetical protein